MALPQWVKAVPIQGLLFSITVLLRDLGWKAHGLLWSLVPPVVPPPLQVYRYRLPKLCGYLLWDPTTLPAERMELSNHISGAVPSLVS